MFAAKNSIYISIHLSIYLSIYVQYSFDWLFVIEVSAQQSSPLDISTKDVCGRKKG